MYEEGRMLMASATVNVLGHEPAGWVSTESKQMHEEGGHRHNRPFHAGGDVAVAKLLERLRIWHSDAETPTTAWKSTAGRATQRRPPRHGWCTTLLPTAMKMKRGWRRG